MTIRGSRFGQRRPTFTATLEGGPRDGQQTVPYAADGEYPTEINVYDGSKYLGRYRLFGEGRYYWWPRRRTEETDG